MRNDAHLDKIDGEPSTAISALSAASTLASLSNMDLVRSAVPAALTRAPRPLRHVQWHRTTGVFGDSAVMWGSRGVTEWVHGTACWPNCQSVSKNIGLLV